ncbi:MAG: poly(A) polymerase, partial [Myxococcota bacterium]
MEWLLDALRVVREVRDWTGTRRRADARADETRRALEDAARDLESFATAEGLDVPPAARVEKADREERLVDPLGPEDPRAAQGDDLADDGAVKTSDDRVRVEDIDPQAVSAIKRLRRYGYKGYLVGGCVRDLLLSISPKDFDIATDARPEEVKSVFRNSRIIGRRFRLVHLYYRGGKVLEVATFRAAITSEEEEEGRGDLLIRRDNVFGTEQEDAQRRDFTINALFYDPERGEIIDHVGGLDDIDAKVVRMIGDPDVRLREDPVRILRAIRFRAKAELTIEPSLEAALSRHVEELVRCPPARLL